MNKLLRPPTETPSKPAGYALPADEIANTITHGIGFLLSLVALGYFWNHTGQQPLGLKISCAIFSVSMATVYLFSTLSHVVMHPRMRQQFRAWDQGTIYLLIAGTYTPFMWEASPPGWTYGMMFCVWLAALWGFFLKVIATYRIDAVSTVTYVLLGWLPAFPLFSRTPLVCVLWMVAGGVSYTLGIVFLVRSHHAWYTHSLWHTMVILGSLCHCIAIDQLLRH